MLLIILLLIVELLSMMLMIMFQLVMLLMIMLSIEILWHAYAIRQEPESPKTRTVNFVDSTRAKY
jgi:hypothetical protein